jgi:hypothetical protein
MQASGESRRNRPIEHACVLAVFAGDKENHWMTTQRDAPLVIRRANNDMDTHDPSLD